jgi:hypothetical protein
MVFYQWGFRIAIAIKFTFPCCFRRFGRVFGLVRGILYENVVVYITIVYVELENKCLKVIQAFQFLICLPRSVSGMYSGYLLRVRAYCKRRKWFDWRMYSENSLNSIFVLRVLLESMF